MELILALIGGAVVAAFVVSVLKGRRYRKAVEAQIMMWGFPIEPIIARAGDVDFGIGIGRACNKGISPAVTAYSIVHTFLHLTKGYSEEDTRREIEANLMLFKHMNI